MGGAMLKLVDAVLFLFMLVIAVAAPLIDFQIILPITYYPDSLIDLKKQVANEYDDYLLGEYPHFFVALIWLELLVTWPLTLLNLYAILASKKWFRTTCLIYGVAVFTSMVPIIGDMVLSGRASDKLKMMYYPFVGFGALAILRGLVPHSGKTTSAIGQRPAFARKKRV